MSECCSEMAQIAAQLVIHNAHMVDHTQQLMIHNATLKEIRDLVYECCHCQTVNMCDITEKVLTRSGLM
jgi:hypothetical protein